MRLSTPPALGSGLYSGLEAPLLKRGDVVKKGVPPALQRVSASSWNDADVQSHLVVASGASNANSLRIVKSGAGLEHLVHLEGLAGVERVWTLDHDR